MSCLISSCLQNHSNSCEASCRFLTHLKNFSSIFTGDASVPPTPGIPTVTNKTFATISLQWEPVMNTSGTPVYMVAMEYNGDSALLSPFFFIDVSMHSCMYVQLYVCVYACMHASNPIRVTFILINELAVVFCFRSNNVYS